MNDQVEVKVSRLKGVALDWSVAKIVWSDRAVCVVEWPSCIRVEVPVSPGSEFRFVYAPSTDWSQGGPLIEQEGITLTYTHDVVRVAQAYHIEDLFDDEREEYCQKGETPLIAAMRCIVARRLGLSVMVPTELL